MPAPIGVSRVVRHAGWLPSRSHGTWQETCWTTGGPRTSLGPMTAVDEARARGEQAAAWVPAEHRDAYLDGAASVLGYRPRIA